MDIKSIQKELKAQKLSGRIFTLGNLFIGEDILPEENRICELTGFTGSYALLFVTPAKAYLFVDGRYELQAKKEINLRRIEIVKLSEISFCSWLKNNFAKSSARIAYNPWIISLSTLNGLKKLLPAAECFGRRYKQNRIYPCRRCRQAVKPQAGKSLHASEKIYRTGFQRQTGAIRRPYQKMRA